MSDALDVVKGVYERFAAGDLEGFLGLCSGEIEWVVNGPASLAKCRAFRGRDGVRAFLDVLQGGWAFTSFTPREFLASGSSVVVLGDETGTERQGGVAFHNRWAHVFDVQDGRVTRFREFLCHFKGSEVPPEMSW